MTTIGINDKTAQRVRAMRELVDRTKQSNSYFYNIPVSELQGGARVVVAGNVMGMFASYSYLGLIGHPRIDAAAVDAIGVYGTGTHGVRTLAGTLTLHRDLEKEIAKFEGAEDAITFSSGYVTNMTTVSSLVGPDDYVLSDKLNHASIIDGCRLSGAKIMTLVSLNYGQVSSNSGLVRSA